MANQSQTGCDYNGKDEDEQEVADGGDRGISGGGGEELRRRRSRGRRACAGPLPTAMSIERGSMGSKKTRRSA